MNGDVRVVAEAEGEFAREGRVELDAVEMGAARCEQGGDGAVAGADLDDGALAEIAQRAGDTKRGGFVDEEVLAELRFRAGLQMECLTGAEDQMAFERRRCVLRAWSQYRGMPKSMTAAPPNEVLGASMKLKRSSAAAARMNSAGTIG